MKYAVEMASGGTIYIPSSITIALGKPFPQAAVLLLFREWTYEISRRDCLKWHKTESEVHDDWLSH
jgi:hypothetical protein